MSINSDAQSYARFIGACSAVAILEGVVTYPFDLVKTRQQVSHPSSSVHTSTTLSYIRATVHAQGAASLYRGFGWAVIGGLPSEVSYYLSYTVLRDSMLSTPIGQQSPSAVYLCAGALADTVSLLLWVPADVVSQRLQIQGLVKPPEKGAVRFHPYPHGAVSSGWQIAMDVWRSEGVVGMWRGLGATLAVHSPSSALFWLSYEHAKRWFAQMLHVAPEDSLRAQVAAGAIAGAASASLTTPLDTIKTRVQCAPTAKSLTVHFWEIVQESNGVRGLFRGFMPRVLASMPRSIVSLVGYELALKWANVSHLLPRDTGL